MTTTHTKTVVDKVATIVPIAHLDLTWWHQRFMALVHLLDHREYEGFYKDRIDEGKYVILDNSTVELGEPYPLVPYVTNAVRLGASEILLPDWLHERDLTVSAAQQGMKVVADTGFKGRVMGVPQGSTQEEWIDCLRDLLDLGVDSIGISRRYLDKFGMSRLFACYVVRHICVVERGDVTVTVHLLGGGAPPEMEVAPCLRLEWVTGVDSAYPSYFAKVGQPIPFNSVLPQGISIDFKERYDRQLMEENIASWRALCTST